VTERTPEVVVIGAGIIGLACALRLQAAGRRVTLFDRDPPGTGASFGNAGHIATEQVFPLASPAVIRGALGYLFDRDSPLRIQPSYLMAILPWLARFTWASRPSAFARGTAALASLQATAAEDFVALLQSAGASRLLHMNGHLVVVEHAASVSAARQELQELARFGVDATWIPAEEVNRHAPGLGISCLGAQHFRGSGHVDDPYAVCVALLDAFRQAGGDFRQEAVTRITPKPGKFLVTAAEGGETCTTQLLLAAGAWSKPLAEQFGYRVPLDTERGYHLTLPGTRPPFELPVACLERKVIMTPMSIGLRMTGTVEFGGMKLPPDPRRIALLKSHLRTLLPDMRIDDASPWMGFRPSLPDHLPMLGAAPGHPGLFFAFGHQHLGLTLAGVTAKLVSQVMNGQSTDISLQPFAVDRFR
jgi:D-amino-acid dehydrogenase